MTPWFQSVGASLLKGIVIGATISAGTASWATGDDVYSALPGQKGFNLEDLLSQTANRSFNGLSEVIAALPEGFRRNHLVVSDSSSLQEATSTDPANPRIILYSPDGKLMVSFSGKGQHSQELEIITYDPAGAKFTFLKARVNESGKFVTQVPEKNECTRCHGADPRPNWQPYPRWPGMLGSEHNRSHPTEASALEALRSSSNPLYRQLPGLGDLTISELTNRNIAFTQAVGRANFGRVSRLIRATPNYASYKYAIFGSLVCESPVDRSDFADYFPPGAIPSDVDLRRFGSDRNYREWSQQPFDWVFKSRGISTSQWDMTFKPDETRAKDFPSPFTTPGQSNNELAAVLAAADPDLLAFISRKEGAYGNEVVYSFKAECNSLKAKSVKALSAAHPSVLGGLTCPPAHGGTAPLPPKLGATISEVRTIAASVAAFPSPPSRLSSCVSCHSPEDSLPIPFSDPAALAAKLRSPLRKGGQQTLIDAILDQVRTGKMPLNTPIGIEERKDLIEYFEKLD